MKKTSFIRILLLSTIGIIVIGFSIFYGINYIKRYFVSQALDRSHCGYVFKYPEDWKIVDTSTNVTLCTELQGPNYHPSSPGFYSARGLKISIYRIKKGTDVSSDPYSEETVKLNSLDNMVEALGPNKDKVNVEDKTYGRYAGKLVSWKAINHNIFIFAHDNYFYRIEWGDEDGSSKIASKFILDVENIIASIQFDEGTSSTPPSRPLKELE